METSIIEALARAARAATTIEELAPPVLQALAHISRLDVTYLTVVDASGRSQTVSAAHAPGEFTVRFGEHFSWNDDLHRPVVLDTSGREASEPASGDLGQIVPASTKTFLSVPVITTDGQVIGALCGAGQTVMALSEGSVAVAELLARLLADQVVRQGGTTRESATADQIHIADARASSAELQAQRSELRADLAEERLKIATRSLHDVVLRFHHLRRRLGLRHAPSRKDLAHRGKTEPEGAGDDVGDPAGDSAGGRRYLLIGNQTLADAHLIAKVTDCVATGPCCFHLLVPATPLHLLARPQPGTATDVAKQHLEQAIERFTALGADMAGEVGNESVALAVSDLLRREHFDEIIVSTLPSGVSRWLRLDLPRRLGRAFDIPVTHVVASADVNA